MVSSVMPRGGHGRLTPQTARRAYMTRRRNNTPNPISPVPMEYFIGGLEIVCPNCSALHFPGETVGRSCHQGKVSLPDLSSFPYEIQELMTSNSVESKYFQTKIRSYNSSLAFASMGAQDLFVTESMDRFIILTGPLHPHDNRVPSYAQLYILDSEAANNIRIAASGPLACHTHILTLLDSVLRRVNPYTSAYRKMHQVEKDKEHRACIENQKMCQVQMLIQRNHCEVAAIFVDQDGHVPSKRDIAVLPHNCGFVRISPLNHNRDPMKYSLLYPAGCRSFEDLRTVDDIVCSTSKEAAQRRGLLADDSEWDACLAEVALFQMPCQLRQLFLRQFSSSIIQTTLDHCGPNTRDILVRTFLVETLTQLVSR
ncbi:hypothetical protein LAZ67_3004487 [Cordylochernes scorpioides]|uniref:Uncharacterized protein n=1 Tax=Cordylochernes scorpioides TaxID=51811 RepID=A0ABY6K9V4_9ARAC|nr:hypothetical protein LAZ67_3004487 [Cordylochernes scorpioides]